MIDLTRIARSKLETQPYSWAAIPELFSAKGAAALAATYPREAFKTLAGNDGEKEYLYDSRSLIAMGASEPSHRAELSNSWVELAHDLVSPGYRSAMSLLTGIDLTAVAIEANVFHFGPGSSLGPHLDLATKIVTHVLYFNRTWNPGDGGCLSILRSSDPEDVAAVIEPVIGNSSVLVRSNRSWHAVQKVVDGSRRSRRSVTVTFYHPGSESSMWPAGDTTPLHRYDPGGLDPD